MDRLKYIIVSFFKSIINLSVVVFSLPSTLVIRKNRIQGKGTIHILGTGPSLKKDYSAFLSGLSESDSLMVVNLFAITDLYEELKPQYYIIADPSFFTAEKNETVSALVSKTEWNVELFIPYTARKSPLICTIKKNKFIHVNYLLNSPVFEGYDSINQFLYKHDMANPPYRNVLIAATFYCIKMRFSKIVIWGADHSWHEDLVLGNDNIVYIVDKHFYGENRKFAHLNKYGNHIKVHEEFFTIARALKVYHSLERFSRLYNCKIVNKSSKTWIDAFSRE